MFDPAMLVMLIPAGAAVLLFLLLQLMLIQKRHISHELDQMIARYHNLRDLHRSLVLDYESLVKDGNE